MQAWRSRPNSARSSACSGSVVVRYLEKTSLAASASGRSILIFTSSRPGRRIAGSIMSSRLEAPMTMTFSSPSTPSISLSNCGTIVVSTSEDTPDPRVRKIESISSKNTMTGVPSEAFSRARWKIIRMVRSGKQRLGQPYHPLLVGVAHDQRSLAAGHHFAQCAHLAGGLERASFHDGQRLIETHALAASQLRDLHRGRYRHPHPATR